MGHAPDEVLIERRPNRSLVVFLAAGVVGLAIAAALQLVRQGEADETAPPPASTTTPGRDEGDTSSSVTLQPPLAADGAPVEVHTELDGRPLDDVTGLEILVGGTLVDVDSDRRTWVAGLTDRPPGREVALETFDVGTASVITRRFACRECDRFDTIVLVLPDGATQAEPVLAGEVLRVAPAPGGIWITRVDHGACTLEEVDLRGRPLSPPRPIDCDLQVSIGTELGLIARGDRGPDGAQVRTDYLLDADSLQTLLHGRHILAVSGGRVLVQDGQDYGLWSPETGERPLPAPGALGEPKQASVSPDGRYAAVAYGGSYLDLWVLDLAEAQWQQVPSFPMPPYERSLDPGWSDDGKLVLFGPFLEGLGGRRELALATWRPWDREVAVRHVDYPPGDLTVRRSGGGS